MSHEMRRQYVRFSEPPYGIILEQKYTTYRNYNLELLTMASSGHLDI